VFVCALGDLWPEMNRESEDQEEPDWVQSEREQFQQRRDKDDNGKLDRKELGDWVIPEDFDHAEAEAKHLIYEADTNKVKYWLHRITQLNAFFRS